MGEIMRFNPAVLPTESTPFGFEFNAHSKGQGPQESQTEVQLIKGLSFFGLGVGTWNTGSMVGSDLAALFEGTSYEAGFREYDSLTPYRTGFRIGGAVQLPLRSVKHRFRIRLGFTFGQGKVKDELSVGRGIVIDLKGFHFGYSATREDLSPGRIVGIETDSYTVGYSIKNLHLNFSRMEVTSAVALEGSNLFSVRYADESVAILASLKTYQNAYGRKLQWPSFTFHKNFGEKLAFGYLYGLYRSSHSLSLQFYL